MFNGNAFLFPLLLADKVVDLGDIRITVEEQAVGRQTVASGAADFLIVTFDALRQIEVNDKTYIGFVDAHAERDRGNDDLYIVANEGFLIPPPLRIVQACMIRTNRIPLRGERRSKIIHLPAREAIDNA